MLVQDNVVTMVPKGYVSISCELTGGFNPRVLPRDWTGTVEIRPTHTHQKWRSFDT